MTVHQIAFMRTQKLFANLTAEELDTAFGGKVDVAAISIYNRQVDVLREQCGCDEIHQECNCDDILVVSGADKTVIFDESGIPD